MIPNFALDNMVEKHLTLLAERGAKEWATNSDNYRNWEQRKRKWKTTASDRVKKSKKQPPPPPPMAVTAAEPFAAVLPFIYDEDPFDEDYVDDSGESDGDVIPIELLMPPDAANNATRRRRRRRRRTNT
ncbi:hypothetical protein QCA50_000084 [Cerrena zonata]|uniref:Uncharacterized protein n=1 Tax=Cerrena zonata TaxID=2478898 RepID=A0AAW0GX97_9APHY